MHGNHDYYHYYCETKEESLVVYRVVVPSYRVVVLNYGEVPNYRVVPRYRVVPSR